MAQRGDRESGVEEQREGVVRGEVGHVGGDSLLPSTCSVATRQTSSLIPAPSPRSHEMALHPAILPLDHG